MPNSSRLARFDRKYCLLRFPSIIVLFDITIHFEHYIYCFSLVYYTSQDPVIQDLFIAGIPSDL